MEAGASERGQAGCSDMGISSHVPGCGLQCGLKGQVGCHPQANFSRGASVPYGVVFPLEAELDAPESAWGHLVGSVCMSEVCAGSMVMLISWGMCAGDMDVRLLEHLCEGPHMLMSICGLWSICESAE